MPELIVDDWFLRIRLSRWERIASVHGSFAVRRAALVGVQPVAEPLAARRGIRVLGTWLPWVLAYGTYRHRGEREFVAAWRRRPGLRITLSGERYAALLLSVVEPERLLEMLET